MTLSIRALAVAAALLPAVSFGADPGARLAGHWEGAIHSPLEEVAVSVDLAAGEAGKLGGTFSSRSQRLNGFPLLGASADGETVKIELKMADPGVRTFEGRFYEDGQTIKGNFLMDVFTVPFTLRRTGDARIAPPPVSAAVDARLAGSWTGALNLGAQSLPLKLMLTNHGDKTSTGTWAAGAGPDIPVAIAYDSGTLTLTSPATPETFTGTLSAEAPALGHVERRARPAACRLHARRERPLKHHRRVCEEADRAP